MRSRTSSSNSLISPLIITNEELGISQSEGALGLSRHEELELGVEAVKQRILALTDNEDQKSLLIEKLIELRTELQDLNVDGSSGCSTRRLGHEFSVSKPTLGESFCEQCLTSVWTTSEAVKCMNCSTFLHTKCISALSRRCMGSGGSYIMNICPEKGLHAQKYRCKDCRCRIAINSNQSVSGSVQARLCYYTGSYYCSVCHWNDLKSIPATVILNWDFTEQKVSRSSYRYLTNSYSKMLVNIEEQNPQLFAFVEELQQMKKLRIDIIRMKVYLSCCPLATKNRLLLRLASQQHFVDSHSEYTLNDLSEINSGNLIDFLTQVHADFARHIKLDCEKCQAKGFICELCSSETVIFPFDAHTDCCQLCGAVYHKECFKASSNCNRCLRMQRKERLHEI